MVARERQIPDESDAIEEAKNDKQTQWGILS